MQMNKLVGVSLTGSRDLGAAKAIGGKPIADLREWLSRVEEIG